MPWRDERVVNDGTSMSGILILGGANAIAEPGGRLRTCGHGVGPGSQSYADVFLLTIADHRQAHCLACGRGVDQVLQLVRTLDLGAVKSDDDVVIFQSRFAGGTILVDIGDKRSAGVAQFQRGGGLLA